MNFVRKVFVNDGTAAEDATKKNGGRRRSLLKLRSSRKCCKDSNEMTLRDSFDDGSGEFTSNASDLSMPFMCKLNPMLECPGEEYIARIGNLSHPVRRSSKAANGNSGTETTNSSTTSMSRSLILPLKSCLRQPGQPSDASTASGSSKSSSCRSSRGRSSSRGSFTKKTASHVQRIKLPSGKVVQRKMSVSFNEDVRVKVVTPMIHLTKYAQEYMWFVQDEYVYIQQKALELVEKVEFGHIQHDETETEEDDETKFSIRGLEHLKRKEAVRKKSLQEYAYQSVFNEQDYQMFHGLFDEDSIAKAYKKACQENLIQAIRRGKHDEIDAGLILYA